MMAGKIVCDTDDAISFCGSVSGETFTSTRKRNTCSLRSHAPDTSNLKGKLDLRSIAFELASKRLKQDDELPKSGFFKSFHHFRFVIILLSGWLFGLMMFLRNNIAVSILKMVNQTHLYMLEHPNRTMEDFLDEGYSLGGEFTWDNEIQQMIMSWYMFAYTIPQVGCTKLGTMLGARWSMPLSLFICALASMLTPMAAYAGWQWVIALRMLNGIGASAILPMVLVMIENWVPYEEISLGLTCAQVLQTLLSALNPLVTSYLCHIHWCYAFYVPSLVAFGTCLLWLIVVTDRPDENWLISQDELIHICGCVRNNHHRHSLSHVHKDNNNHQNVYTMDNNGTISKIKVPNDDDDDDDAEKDAEAAARKLGIADILRVPSFYAFVIIWSFYCSSSASFLFILPTYVRQFLKIGITQNGLYCSLILSGAIISVMWPYPILRLLQNNCKLSPTAARRLTHLLLCLTVGLTWLYVGTYHDAQLLLFFINRCFHGSNDVVVTGTIMSNYGKVGLTGLAYSMVNTCGNLSVVLASTTIGYLLDYTGQSEDGWSYILWALAFSALATHLLFLCTKSEPIEFNTRQQQQLEKPANSINNSNNNNNSNCDSSSSYNKMGEIGERLSAGNLAKTLKAIELPAISSDLDSKVTC